MLPRFVFEDGVLTAAELYPVALGRELPISVKTTFLGLHALPPEFRDNINHDAPFDRGVGEEPRMSEGDIDDIVAFLNTLTDGYKAEKPVAAR